MNEININFLVSVLCLLNSSGSMNERNTATFDSHKNKVLLKTDTNFIKPFVYEDKNYNKYNNTNITNLSVVRDIKQKYEGKYNLTAKNNNYKQEEVIVSKELNFSHLDEDSGRSKIINLTAKSMDKNKSASRVDAQSAVYSSFTDYIWNVLYSFVRCFRENSTMDCLREKATLVLQDLKTTYSAYREDYNKYEMSDEYDVNGVMKVDEGFTPRAKFKKEVKYIMKALKYVSKTVLMVTPFLFFMKLKTMILVSFSIAVLVLMSGKALLMSLVSFTLSVLAFLKNVDASQNKVEELNLYPFKTQRRQGMEYLDGGRKNNEAFFM